MADLSTSLATCKHSAFRLETLPVYAVPQEAEWIANFLRDGSLPEVSPDNHPWLRLVAQARRAGRQMRRVHIITPPLTDYLRFELSMYRFSVAAGEDVRIADCAVSPELAQLTHDFWLFDNQTVFLMDYDHEGHFLGGTEVTDPTPYQRQCEQALACSLSLDDYLARVE